MSVVFTRRTTAPSSTNKYYIKTSYGGYNRCILINSTTGSCLPNCVGYAWGRFCEEQNIHNCNLSRGDAEGWYSHTSDGYTRSRTVPKLGCVICWSSTKSGGHVAIVEKVNSDGSLLTSNSAYGGSRFYMKTVYPPFYRMGSAYTFQGFIYPTVEFTDPDTPVPPPPAVISVKTTPFPWVLFARKFRNRKNK